MGFTASDSASERANFTALQRQCSAPHFGEVHIWRDQNNELCVLEHDLVGRGQHMLTLCDKMPIYTALLL